jgi:hypothetical protein
MSVTAAGGVRPQKTKNPFWLAQLKTGCPRFSRIYLSRDPRWRTAGARKLCFKSALG